MKTLYPQTASSDLFSGEQGMTGYTGQLSGGSWSAVFPKAIFINEKKKVIVSFSLYAQTFLHC